MKTSKKLKQGNGKCRRTFVSLKSFRLRLRLISTRVSKIKNEYMTTVRTVNLGDKQSSPLLSLAVGCESAAEAQAAFGRDLSEIEQSAGCGSDGWLCCNLSNFGTVRELRFNPASSLRQNKPTAEQETQARSLEIIEVAEKDSGGVRRLALSSQGVQLSPLVGWLPALPLLVEIGAPVQLCACTAALRAVAIGERKQQNQENEKEPELSEAQQCLDKLRKQQEDAGAGVTGKIFFSFAF